METNNLAGMIREFLRPVLVVSITNSDKEVVSNENHPASVVKAIFRICIRSEDPFSIDNPCSVEPEAIYDRCTSFQLTERIANVNPAIVRIVGMKREVEQTRVFSRQGGWTCRIVHS